MNMHVKIAYDAGVQVALEEVGLNKQANIPASSLLRNPHLRAALLGGGMGAGGGAMAGDEDDRLRNALIGAAGGGLAGAGLAGLAGRQVDKMVPGADDIQAVLNRDPALRSVIGGPTQRYQEAARVPGPDDLDLGDLGSILGGL